MHDRSLLESYRGIETGPLQISLFGPTGPGLYSDPTRLDVAFGSAHGDSVKLSAVAQVNLENWTPIMIWIWKSFDTRCMSRRKPNTSDRSSVFVERHSVFGSLLVRLSFDSEGN